MNRTLIALLIVIAVFLGFIAWSMWNTTEREAAQEYCADRGSLVVSMLEEQGFTPDDACRRAYSLRSTP